MFRHELYKILSRKSIYILLTLIIMTMIFAASTMSHGATTMEHPIFEEMEEVLGGPITTEKVELAREKMRESDEKGSKEGGPSDMIDLNSEEYYKDTIHFLTVISGMQSDELIEEKETLKREITKHDSGTYAYKLADKKVEMLEEIGQPYGYYVIQAWRGLHILIEPLFGTLFIIVLVLIGLSPIFSEEHTQRTASLIAATKHGKRKVITAKVLASLSYIVGIFIILNAANLLIQWYYHGGFAGGNVPIQSFMDYYMNESLYQYSPFNWTVWQGVAITLGIQLFGAASISVLVLFISSRIKNTMIVFFTSGALITLPALFNTLGLPERFKLFQLIRDFSYLELLRADGLINRFKAYNLFGNPVLYPVLVIAVFTLITIGILALTYYSISKQEINE